MSSLQGKSILVTGGGTGIGAGCAAYFASRGARVTISGRRENRLREVADAIGPACRIVVGDVTSAADRQAMVDAAVAHLRTRCTTARGMPFLEGIPCSAHGIVFPDGVVVLRPAEMVVLRGGRTGFVYFRGGTCWDPPAARREELRALVRRVGGHLRGTPRHPRAGRSAPAPPRVAGRQPRPPVDPLQPDPEAANKIS